MGYIQFGIYHLVYEIKVHMCGIADILNILRVIKSWNSD